jgi:type III secretion system (T3SS) inner membrane Yop/YscD-like protein
VGSPTLTLVPSAGGAPVEVRRDRVLVGRDPGADVVLNDPSVSRRHAVLERRGAIWVVLDQQSANGTWLDDHRVTEAALQAGQRLRLGAVTFGVRLSEVAPAPAASPVPAASPPAANPMPATYARPRPAPAYVAPAPPGRPAPAAPAAGMDRAEAAEMLGLWPGSPPEEVRKRYQKLYNDFQIRLTNAPTPSLKKMYQKSIQDLRAAAEALAPGAV